MMVDGKLTQDERDQIAALVETMARACGGKPSIVVMSGLQAVLCHAMVTICRGKADLALVGLEAFYGDARGQLQALADEQGKAKANAAE